MDLRLHGTVAEVGDQQEEPFEGQFPTAHEGGGFGPVFFDKILGLEDAFDTIKELGTKIVSQVLCQLAWFFS
jgi:hypothetical protein